MLICWFETKCFHQSTQFAWCIRRQNWIFIWKVSNTVSEHFRRMCTTLLWVLPLFIIKVLWLSTGNLPFSVFCPFSASVTILCLLKHLIQQKTSAFTCFINENSVLGVLYKNENMIHSFHRSCDNFFTFFNAFSLPGIIFLTLKTLGQWVCLF